MISKKIAWAMGISSFILAANAFAAGEGFYLGGQIGETNTHNQPRSLQTGTINPITGQVINPGNISVNAGNVGYGGRLYFGYNLNSYFAVESGFTHYGASTYKTGTPSPQLISGNPLGKPGIQENGVDFMGKGIFPIQSFNVFGKLGIAIVRTSLAGTLTTTYTAPPLVPPSGPAAFTTATGTTNYIRPAAAIGASYDITPNWETELTISRAFGGGGFQSADLYSLGISYHFVDKYCGQFLC